MQNRNPIFAGIFQVVKVPYKTAKDPSWTKNMALDTFIRQLEIWGASNVDVPESTQFQGLVESGQLNKEIKGFGF